MLTWKSTESTFTLRCSVTPLPNIYFEFPNQIHESSRTLCGPVFNFRVGSRLVWDLICTAKKYDFTGCSFWHDRWCKHSCLLWPGYATTCRIGTRKCIVNDYCSVTYRSTPVFYYLLFSRAKKILYEYTYRVDICWPRSPCVVFRWWHFDTYANSIKLQTHEMGKVTGWDWPLCNVSDR